MLPWRQGVSLTRAQKRIRHHQHSRWRVRESKQSCRKHYYTSDYFCVCVCVCVCFIIITLKNIDCNGLKTLQLKFRCPQAAIIFNCDDQKRAPGQRNINKQYYYLFVPRIRRNIFNILHDTQKKNLFFPFLNNENYTVRHYQLAFVISFRCSILFWGALRIEGERCSKLVTTGIDVSPLN